MRRGGGEVADRSILLAVALLVVLSPAVGGIGPGAHPIPTAGPRLASLGELRDRPSVPRGATPTADVLSLGSARGSSSGVAIENITQSPGSPGWVGLNVSAAPPWREGGTAAYDPGIGGVLLFGGSQQAGPALYATWEFVNNTWTEVCSGNSSAPTCPQSPSPRYWPVMAYDSSSSQLVLFGGVVDLLGMYGLNDTWIFANGGWSELNGSPAPPLDTSNGGLYGMVDDPGLGGLLLFSPVSGTWRFSNDSWTNLTRPSGPKGFGGMFYDNGTHSVILWSGSSGQTWAFASGNWTRVAAADTPAAYYAISSVYVPAFDYGLVLGLNGSNATWMYSNGTWSNVTTELGPPPPDSPGLRPVFAYDPTLAGTLGLGWEFVSSNTSGRIESQTMLLVDPLRVAISVSQNVRDLGESVAFQASVAGGRVPYATRLSGAPAPCGWPANLSPNAFLNCTLETTGSFGLNVSVVDANHSMVYAVLPLAVYPHLSASVTGGPNPADAGRNISLDGTIQGGAPPVVENWTVSTGANGSEVGREYDNLSLSFPASGHYWANLTVTDATGAVSAVDTPIVVFSPVAVQAAVNFTQTEVGLPVGFNASASGGDAPVALTWGFGDGTFASTGNVSHTYAAPGNYAATAWANDSAGGSAEQTVEVRVAAALQVTAAANVTQALADQPIAFRATVNGGLGPYSYFWNFGDAATSVLSAPLYTFPTVGNHSVSVEVYDALGVGRSSTVTVDVVASTGPLSNATASPAVPLWVYAVAAGSAAILLAVGATAMVVRKRRS